MFTDEDLPPAPRFKLSKWLFSGLMAWSLFFGAVGGLAILMLGDMFFDLPTVSEHRELIEDNRIEQQVVAVDRRVTDLERQTRQIKNIPEDATPETPARTEDDNRLTRILIGLTQLKTAYDSETPLQPGIDLLKQSVTDSGLQHSLEELSRLTATNFPSREKILNDLHQLQAGDKNAPANKTANDPNLGWRERAIQAAGQWVRVTPTDQIVNNQSLTRVEQAVSGGDFALAEKYLSGLPKNPATALIAAQIATRLKGQILVHDVINRIGSGVSQAAGQVTGKGTLY